MQVIILAGGHAHRLWPLTEQYPKPLLHIAGKPVLYHLLENISHIPEIQSVTIAIDDTKRNYFNKELDALNVTMNPRPRISLHTTYPSGEIKGPVKKISEILSGLKKADQQDDFLILGGDNVFGFSLVQFFSFFRNNGKNCNAIQCVEEAESKSEFGIPSVDDSGRMTDFIEKPESACIKMISTACYAFHGPDLLKVDEYLAANSNDDRLGEFVRWELARTEMVGFQFQDPWFDTGSRSGLLDANSFLIQWKEANRKVPMITGRTRISTPVYIEDTVYIEDSVIGPNVYIAKNVQIVNSRIKNSIVYEGCVVRNSLLDRSIVGNDSTVDGSVSGAVFGPHSKFLGEAVRK